MKENYIESLLKGAIFLNFLNAIFMKWNYFIKWHYFIRWQISDLFDRLSDRKYAVEVSKGLEYQNEVKWKKSWHHDYVA